MIYLLLLVIGFILGGYFKDSISKFIKKYIIVKKNNYKVKFNIYFVIYRNNSKLNEIIRTETIEISVMAEDEDEVNTLISNLVDNGIKFEIENIQKL